MPRASGIGRTRSRERKRASVPGVKGPRVPCLKLNPS